MFIETREHRRFEEFCDACRRFQYIGLCHGPPGVGKTLSARRYAHWDEIQAASPVYGEPDASELVRKVLKSGSIFYTVGVANAPKQVAGDIQRLRDHMRSFPLKVLDSKMQWLAKGAEERDMREDPWQFQYDLFGRNSENLRDPKPSVLEVRLQHAEASAAVKDPTRLILIDEADRLKMTCLEQIRSVFDEGGVGLVLIGMPGIEKRLARYPQLYSRVGFVHEFPPLPQADVRQLLQEQWRPKDAMLPDRALADDEGIAAIIRITGGNFRLLHRLLTQIARVLKINRLELATAEVVEAARENLVIGTE